jgi:hypothetical protein
MSIGVTLRRLCKVLACGVASTAIVTAPSVTAGAEAAKPGNPNAILQIHPGGGPSRFGDVQTLEAQVSLPSGKGLEGVAVDFEVVSGPADGDGNTPQTPDLTCTTSGGDAHHPATCTVTYAESMNQGGSDAVMAWIDADGDTSTVEADTSEGENENAPGSGGCAPGTKGPGATPEPDATDCVEKRWLARVATTVELTPNASKAPLATPVDFTVLVRDQFGDQLGGLARASVAVSFEILAGSAHDPGDGNDFSSPDLGTCTTGPDGRCTVPFTATSGGGTDTVCAYLPGKANACGQLPDTGPATGGAVVTRAWEAPAEEGGDPTPTPLPAAPVPPATPSQPTGPGEADAHATQPEESPERPEPHPSDPRGSDSPERRPSEPTESQAPTARTLPATHGNPERLPVTHSRPAQHRAHHHTPRAPRSPGRAPLRRAGIVTRRTADADSSSRAATPRGHRRPAHASPISLRALSDAALTTAHKLSFPLGLTLLVVAFLAIQGRLDRRDPKLRLAPVDSKHDLVPFT